VGLCVHMPHKTPTPMSPKWKKCTSTEEKVRHAVAGWQVCWQSASFRAGVVVTVIGLSLAAMLGTSAPMMGVLVLAFAVAWISEMVNTGIELAVDRVGTEWHPLSRDAKDVAACAATLAYTIAIAMCSMCILYHGVCRVKRV
jgi:diacylglycerol kinase (ATP)